MKVDLKQPIKNFDGKNIIEGKNAEMAEVGTIIRNALGAGNEKDNGDKMLKKFKLGLKCVADEVELTPEEVALIKKTLENHQITPLAYGRIIEAIDPGALKD